jgi:iron complex outermembrane receptor protein
LFQHTTANIIQGTIKADLGFANLTSYTQYRSEIVNAVITQDYTGALVVPDPMTFAPVANLNGNPYLILGLPNSNATGSEEILLTSKPGPRLQWTVGGFYFANRDTYITYFNDFYFFGPLVPPKRLGGSSTTTGNLSGFADGTYQITDQLFLTAGVRLSHDVVYDAYWNTQFLAPSYTGANGQQIPAPNGSVQVPDIHSFHVVPRAVVRYKPDDHSSVYASFTEGYKAAIIDVGGSCQDNTSNFGNPPYTCNSVKPEKIYAYEVGYKYDDHRFSADLSAYYYNYKNLQVSVYLANAQAFILNAASSHIYGFDGQFDAKLIDHFDIQAAGAYTHARFVEFGNAPEFQNTNGVFSVIPNYTLRGTPMARAPDWTGNVMLRYTDDLAGGKLVLSSGLNYTSKVYFGPAGNQFPQSAYATLDARAEWTDPSKHYTLAVFGTNLTNKAYRTEVQTDQAGFGANWARPIFYGVEVGAKF